MFKHHKFMIAPSINPVAMKTFFACWMVLALALLLPPAVQAQTLPSENVTVLKNFEAQLLDAERINVDPTLPAPDTVRSEQVYRLPYRELNIDYPPPSIRPYGMRREKMADSYHGIIRAGGGFPNSLYGNGSFRYLFEDKMDLGIHINHHSASYKKLENQRFSNTDAGLEGTYYFDQGFAVNAGLGYDQKNVFFYGYNLDPNFSDTIMIPADDVHQRFSTIRLHGGIFNGERTVADFNYKAHLDAYFLNDSYASKEKGFDLKIEGTKWFAEKHSLDVLLRTDFTFFEDTISKKLHNFYLIPAFTFHADAFSLKLGVNITSHNDKFDYFPDALFTLNILGSQLAAFAGAEGTLQKNTFQSLTTYNPFLVSRPDLRNTRVMHFFGGVKGNVSIFEYSGQVGYKRTRDLALFQLQENPLIPAHRRFDVLYDTVSIININGSLIVNLIEGLRIMGTVNQNIYTTTQQEKAWYLPALSINGAVQYTTLEDKLVVRGEVFLENGVPYLNQEGKADNLNALFDVSLGAEYFFTKNIGAFLKVNNLADNQRQRWLYYPTYGINALAGVSARF
ncbi:MAG: hypothetical protein H6563_09990 [Lewinellaceae bacterium]|nr:hypothetical protein [Lewinellaceae bacterium]